MKEEENQQKAKILSILFDNTFHALTYFRRSLSILRDHSTHSWMTDLEESFLKDYPNTKKFTNEILGFSKKKGSQEAMVFGTHILKNQSNLSQNTNYIYDIGKELNILADKTTKYEILKSHVELCFVYSHSLTYYYSIGSYQIWLKKNELFRLQDTVDKLDFEKTRKDEMMKLDWDSYWQKTSRRNSSSFNEEQAIMNAINQGQGDNFGY